MATNIIFLDGPTIAAGASLSDAIDCTNGTIVRITMPPTWTSAPLTFLLSRDNVIPYSYLCERDGSELTIAVQAASTLIGTRLPAAWVKFRSGTVSRPIIQPATRAFKVALNPQLIT